MRRSSGFRSGRGRGVLPVVGWVLAVALGIGLVWLGFTLDKGDRSPEDAQSSVTTAATPAQATVWPTITPLPSATVPIIPTLTDTPLPVATREPTVIPATATSVVATIVTGADGANVRSGPGTNYTRLGYLDPGAEAEVIGRYSDWWQIRYDETPGWIFGEIVTASNADGVPQVEPPPAPTAAPSAATPVPTTAPPAATSVPAADFRGLVPDEYQVEGAPGPYGVDQDICFNMWITNKSDETVEYDALGTWVEETGQFQKSYFSAPPTYPSFVPGQNFHHRDCLRIPAPGTYNLWMAIHFIDGTAVLLKGPVSVVVQ